MSATDSLTGHQPIVTSGRIQGQWLVFCEACSSEAGDYVPRCKRADDLPDGWPPRTLWEDEPPTSRRGR